MSYRTAVRSCFATSAQLILLGRLLEYLLFTEMLERDFYEVPDLYFNIQLLIPSRLI
jgi:predicted ester cyclase